MTNLKIMQWNIESFSDKKSQIAPTTPPGMILNIAKVIHSEQPDITIILELKTVNTAQIMNRLKIALQGLPGGANLYQTYFFSETTGTDRYGFIIRDNTKVRPLSLSAKKPNNAANPLRKIDDLIFEVTAGTQIAAGKTAAFLVDLYANRFTGKDKASFAGQSLANGGFSTGIGFRLPCLAMFEITDANNRPVVIPIVVCHYGAKRDRYSGNHLANEQIRALKYLHIAQLYATNGNIKKTSGPLSIQNIIFAGDFNVDFLMNYNVGGVGKGRKIIQQVTKAYANLTPTQRQGGSDRTKGSNRGATPDTDDPPRIFNPPLRHLGLISGLTNEATILDHYSIPLNATATQQLRTSCFDNFFFGGTHLGGQDKLVMLGPNPPPQPPPLDCPDSVPAPPNVAPQQDCAKVIDVPQMIGPNPLQTQDQVLNLQNIAQHYANKTYVIYDVGSPNSKKRKIIGSGTGVKNARYAIALLNGWPPTLTDQLIGARLLSDHLPVMVEFNI